MEWNGDVKIHSDEQHKILGYCMLMVSCFSFCFFFVITALVNIMILRQHSSSYTSKVTGKQYKILCMSIARVQILFTFLSVPFVASNTLASLSSPSTNIWMDTGVTLQKSHFFLWASTSNCLTTVSRILTEWKSSSLNRTVCGVIFNVRIGKYFGLKNSDAPEW